MYRLLHLSSHLTEDEIQQFVTEFLEWRKMNGVKDWAVVAEQLVKTKSESERVNMSEIKWKFF